MGDQRHHATIAEENLRGAEDELRKGRFSNVGLLSVRSLEQMVEASAAREGLHFHELPRSAHSKRRAWLRARHPDLVRDWDQLWDVYAELGYGGADGGRAKKALTVLKRCLRELGRREGIAVAGL